MKKTYLNLACSCCFSYPFQKSGKKSQKKCKADDDDEDGDDDDQEGGDDEVLPTVCPVEEAA